ncbi:MAG TPA: glycine--tRNA ligase, partial [Candidatus Pacearchaeota archaeon]|nr:glycine--tRNA ligase [Candidatus Pacearchaeota archaeon]
ETCQGIFVNFKNVLDSSRVKVPFGIAQIGKSFRNEITPGNFIFRMREFEQMEMEWFCQPDSSKTPDDWFEEWKAHRLQWYLTHGISQEHLRFAEVEKKDRAHYAQRQVDLEYLFPFGWKEIEGIHNRGDWDLSNHAKFSKQDLQVLDETNKTKYYPHIIETSVGVERSLLAFLCESYEEVEGGRSTTTEAVKDIEVNLNLHKTLAPIKVAVLPLVKNKAEIAAKAYDIFSELKSDFSCQYDETGTIGKRYRRQDEIGTPFCLTVDFDSLQDSTITLRDRKTMAQERIRIADIKKIISEKLR